MPRTCFFCGKGPSFGRRISRRGMAKAKGGVGQKITGISVRKFNPNLQRVKAVIEGPPRRTKTIYACTKCIHMGRVIKPVQISQAKA